MDREAACFVGCRRLVKGQVLSQVHLQLPAHTVESFFLLLVSEWNALAAVDPALARLARSGELLRVSPGRCVRPRRTPFGVKPPSGRQVAE